MIVLELRRSSNREVEKCDTSFSNGALRLGPFSLMLFDLEGSHDRMSKTGRLRDGKKGIAALEKEKASVARQTAAGVTSVMPVGAALALVTGATKARA